MSTEPSLALQKAVRDRLAADAGVLALVPANSIFDRSRRPETFPCIIIGEGQTINLSDTIMRNHVRCYADLHVWAEEDGTVLSKQTTEAIYQALQARFFAVAEHPVIDFNVASARFMRDVTNAAQPHSHAVISVSALMERMQ